MERCPDRSAQERRPGRHGRRRNRVQVHGIFVGTLLGRSRRRWPLGKILGPGKCACGEAWRRTSRGTRLPRLSRSSIGRWFRIGGSCRTRARRAPIHAMTGDSGSQGSGIRRQMQALANLVPRVHPSPQFDHHKPWDTEGDPKNFYGRWLTLNFTDAAFDFRTVNSRSPFWWTFERPGAVLQGDDADRGCSHNRVPRKSEGR